MPQTNKIHTKMRPKRTCLFLFRLSAALFALLIFLRFLFCCTIFSTCRPFFSSCFLLDHHCRNDRCCNHRNNDNHNYNCNDFSYFFVVKIHFLSLFSIHHILYFLLPFCNNHYLEIPFFMS